MLNPAHEQLVQHLFTHACIILRHKGLSFRPMQGRAGGVKNTKSYTLGHTNLKKGTITVDIYTPRHRKPKSYNSILRIIAHEIAHHQKPPYRQLYRGHLINRQHYPSFYKQVTKNIKKFQKDEVLEKYFT
ncbi:hypothetical protein HQ544_01145 [Candidatus Falkowbacteria bacterium]|nr:hypothetical protein [Candidatus Falkowbacteria bacterium]